MEMPSEVTRVLLPIYKSRCRCFHERMIFSEVGTPYFKDGHHKTKPRETLSMGEIVEKLEHCTVLVGKKTGAAIMGNKVKYF